MTKPLDVLLIEAHPGDADLAAHQLEGAGHRVHRCYGADEPVLCRGVTEQACPIDGGVDVALLARGGTAPKPTATEAGVACALRAGLPLVELGSGILDPFEPWVVVWVDDDLVGSVEEGAQRGYDSLRAGILVRIERSLRSAGVDPADVEMTFVHEPPRLTVELRGPVVDSRVRQALGVRVLDALRAESRTYGQVDVTYDPIA